MKIAPEVKEAIVSGDISLAETKLNHFLATFDWSLSDLAELGGALIERGRFELATILFAQWTQTTPDNPEPWSNLGLCLSRSHKPEEAKQVLEYALEINSSYLPAINNLCEVYQHLKRHDLQLKNALHAIKCSPDSALSFNNLGTAFVDNGMMSEAKYAFETSLMLDPLSFEAIFNLAKIASDSGDSAQAIRYLSDSKDKLAHRNTRQIDLLEFQLGVEYLSCGKLNEGWHFFEKGFSPDIPASFARTPRRNFLVPKWQGQNLLPGQTLMIWREQGIGDDLRFSALLPRLLQISGRIIIECDPRLVDVFRRSFPTFQIRESISDSERVLPPERGDYDFHISMGSLAGLYMQSPEIFDDLGGYLQPAVVQTAKYAQRLVEFDGLKKIGICWRSHQLSATRNKKYTVLEDWHEILSMPGVVFVNLQYGDCEQELVDAEQRYGIKILRWSDTDLKNDLEAVMGLMANLDLVISPSTAVVPLAGAIGRKTIFIGHPTWVMLGEKARYPWFSSVHPILVDKTLPVASGLPAAKILMDQLLQL